MSDPTTKQKIVHASIKLFNENGVANVRLQQIADEIGISVGNLAYHFKNKEAIIGSIMEYLEVEITGILGAFNIYPNLLDFDNQLSKAYNFLDKYPFFILDLQELERIIPDLHELRKQQIAQLMSQIRKRLDMNVRRGLLKTEQRKGQYESLTLSIFMIMAYWPNQIAARGIHPHPTMQKFKEVFWNLIYPNLTEIGIAEFKQLIVPMLKPHRKSEKSN